MKTFIALLISCSILFSWVNIASPGFAQTRTDSPGDPATSESPATSVQPPTSRGGTPIYSGQFSTTRNAERYSFTNVVTNLLPSVATWLAGFLAALAVIFLIVAGFQFITAGGEPDKITQASKTAFYVLAGVLLSMFAYAIVYLILTIFTPA